MTDDKSNGEPKGTTATPLETAEQLRAMAEKYQRSTIKPLDGRVARKAVGSDSQYFGF